MIKITETPALLTIEAAKSDSNRDIVNALHAHDTAWESKCWLFAGEVRFKDPGKKIEITRV